MYLLVIEMLIVLSVHKIVVITSRRAREGVIIIKVSSGVAAYFDGFKATKPSSHVSFHIPGKCASRCHDFADMSLAHISYEHVM
jgi:hypothetical protein